MHLYASHMVMPHKCCMFFTIQIRFPKIDLFVLGYQFDSKSVTWKNHVSEVSWFLCCARLGAHYYTPVVSDCEQMLMSVL
uniref:Uncharacterized protein n=1 Tax=Arundo donax TaxID=35708 RepID=A0A0A9CQF2_ARUDO